MDVLAGNRFRTLVRALSFGWLSPSMDGASLESANSQRRLFISLIGLTLVLGAGLRVHHFCLNRNLYNDELYVAKNIRDVSAWDLNKPLWNDQRAPIGFLLAVKFSWEWIASNDYGLRLFSQVCGLVALLAFYPCARRYLSPGASLLALALFALCDPLIFYSTELKPYGVEAMASVLVLWALAPLGTQPLTWRRAVALGSLGSVLIFFSFSTVVVLAISGLVLAGMLLVSRRWAELPKAALIGAFWIAGIVALYFVQFRNYGDSEALKAFWGMFGDYAPQPLRLGSTLDWLAGRLGQLAGFCVGYPTSLLAGFACVLGVASLLRGHRYHLALLIGPIGMAVVLALIRFYPFSGRLMIYLIPAAIILIAAGARSLAHGNSSTRAVAVLATLFLIVPSAWTCSRNIKLKAEPHTIVYPGYAQARIKPAMTFIRDHWQPGDVLYCVGESNLWLEHYAAEFPFEAKSIVSTLPVYEDFFDLTWGRRKQHLDQTVTGKPRVWFLFAQSVSFVIKETEFYPQNLDKMGRPLLRYQPPNSVAGHAHLYDLSAAR